MVDFLMDFDIKIGEFPGDFGSILTTFPLFFHCNSRVENLLEAVVVTGIVQILPHHILTKPHHNPTIISQNLTIISQNLTVYSKSFSVDSKFLLQ